jgi:hypothetical protein
MKEDAAVVERLWQSARFLPQSVRLLGTRYRALFTAYAQQVQAEGDTAPVADAIAFVDFMFRQNRVALLMPEQRALRNDERALRRRYSLKRSGATVKAVEKWKIRQWLRL